MSGTSDSEERRLGETEESGAEIAATGSSEAAVRTSSETGVPSSSENDDASAAEHAVPGSLEPVSSPRPVLSAAALLNTMALLMFVGGSLVTLIMVSRAFALHGTVLVVFVIAGCSLILGLAGGLLLKTLGDKWWIGAVIGACFGAISAILVYVQTMHHDWWR